MVLTSLMDWGTYGLAPKAYSLFALLVPYIEPKDLLLLSQKKDFWGGY